MGKRGGPGPEEAMRQVEREDDERVKPILEEIARRRDAAKKEGQSFTAPTERELRAKLHRHNSPMITSEGWTTYASPGANISYTVGVHNPDSTTAYYLFGHVFVGPANPVSDVGAALALVDPRWPRLTQPPTFGATLAPGASTSFSYQIAIPAGMQVSYYMGNCFLVQVNWTDVGTCYDRGCFVFGVQ